MNISDTLRFSSPAYLCDLCLTCLHPLILLDSFLLASRPRMSIWPSSQSGAFSISDPSTNDGQSSTRRFCNVAPWTPAPAPCILSNACIITLNALPTCKAFCPPLGTHPCICTRVAHKARYPLPRHHLAQHDCITVSTCTQVSWQSSDLRCGGDGVQPWTIRHEYDDSAFPQTVVTCAVLVHYATYAVIMR